MRWTPALLEALVELFKDVLRFDRPADKLLSDYFRANRELGHAERGLLAETVYAGLRSKRLIDLAVEEAGPLSRAPVQTEKQQARAFALAALMRAQGVHLRELESAVRRDEIEWLARAKGGARGDLPLAVRCDLPDWVVESLSAQMPAAELEALAQALRQPAPLDLRVNLLKAEREAVLARLTDEGIAAAPTPHSPSGIRLAGKPALQRHPLFVEGEVEVQDEGSQLLCYLLAPKRGEMVADFCAGAGGKTLALSALMRNTGRVYAFDVSDKRLAKLKPRLARSGASNIDSRHMESERDPKLGRLAGKLDRVLVDAPCSGLGTLRRNPDLKWRQGPESVRQLKDKQLQILRAAAKLLKPGGRLVYATCSILAEENEGVIEAFLAERPDFQPLPAQGILADQRIALEMPQTDPFLRLRPHVHGTDGFFAAALEYRPAA